MKKFFKVIGLIIGMIVLLVVSVIVGKNVVASKFNSNSTNTNSSTNIITNTPKEAENLNTAKDNNIATKLESTKEFIYEKSVKEINETYDKENGYTFEDKIRLPFINIDSEDVERTNSKLQEKYNTAVNSFKREEYGFSFTRMDYEEHIIDDKYVSLSVCEMPVHVPGGDFLEYYTLYNFDLQAGGKKLSKREIIDKFDITPNQLEEKVKEALTKDYNEYEYAEEDFGTLEQFMSNSKYHFENLQLLITGEKTLDVYLEFPVGPEGVRTGVLSIEL